MSKQIIKRHYFELVLLSFFFLVLVACGDSDFLPISSEPITDLARQDSLFKSLTGIVNDVIPENELNDSLAFMVLPVEASCPSCRRKTIDSIVKYQNNLLPNRYIIITAKGGRKIMNAYFREQNTSLPDLPGHLILDSINQAAKNQLFTTNTVFYYTANRKVYLKVSAVPATIKNDLHHFFSRSSDQILMAKESH